jgi:hypothetical protein
MMKGAIYFLKRVSLPLKLMIIAYERIVSVKHVVVGIFFIRNRLNNYNFVLSTFIRKEKYYESKI